MLLFIVKGTFVPVFLFIVKGTLVPRKVGGWFCYLLSREHLCQGKWVGDVDIVKGREVGVWCCYLLAREHLCQGKWVGSVAIYCQGNVCAKESGWVVLLLSKDHFVPRKVGG